MGIVDKQGYNLCISILEFKLSFSVNLNLSNFSDLCISILEFK